MQNVFRLSQFTPPPLGAGEEPPVGEVCYENIGPRERALRARLGYVMLAVGLAVAAALVLADAAWWWRLLVFFLFASGASSWLQARERT